MLMTSYEITVCDKNPTTGAVGINCNCYKFSNRRRAIAFAEESMRQGHFVVMNTFEVDRYGLSDLARPQYEENLPMNAGRSQY